MKTQEQKAQDAKDYIAKSAQHLFIVNDKLIYKVIPFYKDDVLHYAKLTLGSEYANIEIVNLNSYKWDLKYTLFPSYSKTKSIPYFKKMRELVEGITAELSTTDNKALIEKMKSKYKTLELVKV